MKIITYIISIAVFLSSCWSNPRPKKDNDPRLIEDSLIDNSADRYERELLILDSISNSWGWKSQTLIGGILLHNEIDIEGDLNVDGDNVFLEINVSLVNGNHCFASDSIQFTIGNYSGPPMLEEISRNISPGDSVIALVPSNMGYGVRGLQGLVPPGAMLLVELSQPITH